MTQRNRNKRLLIAACSLAVVALGGPALAASANAQRIGASNVGETTGKATRGDMKDAERQIGDAAQVVRRMEVDPDAARLLGQAHGVFVVTDYGHAAIGGSGEGVLMIRKNGRWQNPAFYTFGGGGSTGAASRVAGGSLVYALNTDKAVKAFDRDGNWLLAEAGLTVVAWSGEAQASAGNADVTVWSDPKGLVGSVAVSLPEIRFDAGRTDAFYGKPMKLADVFGGNATPAGNAAPLQGALFAAGSMGGADSQSAANIMRNASASASPDPNALPGH